MSLLKSIMYAFTIRLALCKCFISPSISPVLCRCGICLGCYIHPPLGTQHPRWGLPHYRSRGHAEPLWYHNVMTQLRPGKILSALGLNKARTDLLLGRPYTPKRWNMNVQPKRGWWIGILKFILTNPHNKQSNILMKLKAINSI